MRISYDKDAKPVETEVQKWNLPTDAQGSAEVQIKAEKGGQYRLSYKVTDAKQHVIEGGYVFCVIGEGAAPGDFRFNDIELVTDKREYAPGDKVNLLVNTARPDSWIVLFLRPADGMYLMPKIVHAEGKSTQEVIEVVKKDMPNFFVEAFTVADGQSLHRDARSGRPAGKPHPRRRRQALSPRSTSPARRPSSSSS